MCVKGPGFVRAFFIYKTPFREGLFYIKKPHKKTP